MKKVSILVEIEQSTLDKLTEIAAVETRTFENVDQRKATIGSVIDGLVRHSDSKRRGRDAEGRVFAEQF